MKVDSVKFNGHLFLASNPSVRRFTPQPKKSRASQQVGRETVVQSDSLFQRFFSGRLSVKEVTDQLVRLVPGNQRKWLVQRAFDLVNNKPKRQSKANELTSMLNAMA